MNHERLDTFDEEMRFIETRTREEVHQLGLWHKTFHCWCFQVEEGIPYIVFQKRQKNKDSFPNLLDISAAGHLVAGEDERDGVRELHEELGIQVAFEELNAAGVMKYELKKDGFIDHEFCFVYVYHLEQILNSLCPDESEVAGLFRIPFRELLDLYEGKKENATISGFEYQNGVKIDKEFSVFKKDFVPHHESYYEFVIGALESEINNHEAT